MSQQPKQKLFRAEAILSATSVASVEDALKVVRPPLFLLWGVLLGLIASVSTWSILKDVPVSAMGNGILIGSAGETTIVADTQGLVEQMSVRTGDVIKAGDVIAVVNQFEQKLQLESAISELNEAQAARAEISKSQRLNSEANERLRTARGDGLARMLAGQQGRLGMMVDHEKVMIDLADRGLTTRDKALSAQMETLGVRDQIETLNNEIRKLALDALTLATQGEREMMAANQKVDSAERQVAIINERILRQGAVRSDVGGRVVEIKVNVGDVVSRGVQLVKVVRGDPADGLMAVAYVDIQDGKKLRPDMQVEIQPATTRRAEHGFLVGHITRVADAPASNSGMLRTLQNDALVKEFQNGHVAVFEVRVSIDRNAAGDLVWSNGSGPDFPIEAGTPLTLQATVRKVRMISLAFPALQRWLVDVEEIAPRRSSAALMPSSPGQ